MKNTFTRFLIFAFLFFPIFSFSQGENNMWYFGHHAGLNFNSGSPVPINNAATMFWGYECTSTPSDSLGNILFYESASYVFNRNNTVMPNGSLLGTVDQPNQPFFAVKKQDDGEI